MDVSKATTSATPNPMAAMLHKASIKTVKGGEFSNTAGDTIKIVLNNYFTGQGENLALDSSDIIDHLLKVIPLVLAELRKNERSQSIVTETTGTDDSDQVSPAIEHSLEGHIVDVIDMIPPEPSTSPVTSVADRYTRSMLKFSVGYPLYNPKPFSEHSKEYLRNGVNVGDVGFIRGDGTFDFLFNICPSKNDIINPPNLPDCFSLESPHQSARIDLEPLSRNTSMFQSPVTTDSDEYICEGSDGAILELPEGAVRDEATNIFPFEKLAARHGVEWYEYTMTRGRKISNGSLYLITSSTKCTQWGTAVFDRPCAPGQGLRFNKKKSFPFSRSPAKYQWKGSTRVFPTMVFNPPKRDVPNQCVFLGGYKIMVRQDIFDNLYNNQLRGSESTSLTRQRATRIRGGAGPDPMSKKLTSGSLLSPSRMSTMTEFGESVDDNSLLVHPSDLINAALLSQNLNAKVALTHDNVWCNLLRNKFPKVNYATLINIARSYTIAIDEYDCVSLQETSDPSNILNRSSPKDYTTVSFLISRTLPRELVERILRLLDTNSMLTCKLVNRTFNDIIQSSSVLRYFLACKAAGVIDNPKSPLVSAGRLEALLKREDAWRTLKPAFESTIEVNHQQSESLLYALTEGAYFLDDQNKKDLHYCQLPSSPQDNPQWIRIRGHDPEDGILIGFATAIYEHDLIIKIFSSDIGNHTDTQRYSLDLVLLNFSTGEYHPLARNPRIHVQRSPSAQFWICPTAVGDNFALVVHSQDNTLPDTLFIFDWKSGHKRLQHETTENAYSDLVFVSPEILLVPNSIRSHFEVWHIPPHPNPKPPVQILALQLPVISPDCSLVSISCDGEPNPFLHSIPYLPPRPFFPSPENSIVVVNLRFSSNSYLHRRQNASYMLIMHRHVLLDMIEERALPSPVEQDLPTWLTNEFTVHSTDSDDGSVRLGAQSKISTIQYPEPSPRTRGSEIYTTSPTFSTSADSVFSSIPSESSKTLTPSRYNYLQVNWADWGPPISRWFQVKEIKGQFTTSFGQRCAFLVPDPRDKKKSMVTVLDFNPHNVRRNAEMEIRLQGECEDKSGNGNNGERKEEEDEDEFEILDHRGVFSEEVYMGLKCVIWNAPDEYAFNELLMDEERLLGLKLDRKRRVESAKVLYFG